MSDSFTNQLVISPVVPMSFGAVVSYNPPDAGSAAIEIQNTFENVDQHYFCLNFFHHIQTLMIYIYWQTLYNF